jgi:hypothetical protein
VDECKLLLQGKGAAIPASHGSAVQVDPIKPTSKVPGTKRSKLEYDKPLSSFAFNLSLRRYNTWPYFDATAAKGGNHIWLGGC